jgi:hypothetical protein
MQHILQKYTLYTCYQSAQSAHPPTYIYLRITKQSNEHCAWYACNYLMSKIILQFHIFNI